MGLGKVGVAALLCLTFAGEAKQKAPCPHPYFPMSDTLELTYRAGKAEVKIRYSGVRTKGGTQTGTLHLAHKGKDAETTATCDAEGIKTELGGIEGAALSMSGMDVKVVGSEGIALPPPDQMVEGATWSNTLKLELRPPEGSGLPFGVVKTTFTKESTILGREEIEVAGRTWDALRVRNRITARSGTAGKRTMESILWMAPGVGILKIQTGDVVDFELLKVGAPPRAEGPRSHPKGASR